MKPYAYLACLLVLVSVLTSTQGLGGAEIETQKLDPCPASPNCVSSQSQDPKYFIEPLRYSGERSDAIQTLIDYFLDQKRVHITDDRDGYLKVECRSLIFRFVDVAEFYFPLGKKIIHVRSASRTGYYDFGVNRRRIERIRKLFTQD